MFSVLRYAARQAGSGALGSHVFEWPVKSAKPCSPKLVLIADLVIDAQVEAADACRVWNKLSGVDASCLRCRLRKEQVLQLHIDRVRRNIDDVARERLTGQRIPDNRARCRCGAAASGEK